MTTLRQQLDRLRRRVADRPPEQRSAADMTDEELLAIIGRGADVTDAELAIIAGSVPVDEGSGTGDPSPTT